jgi:hypothetical protein
LTRNKDVWIIDHYRAAGPIGLLFAPLRVRGWQRIAPPQRAQQ